MKIVIDIPDKLYEEYIANGIIYNTDSFRLFEAIANGIPLDDIKAEINQYGSIWVQYTIKGHTDKDIEDLIEDVLSQAKRQVLNIIDRHIGERSE